MPAWRTARITTGQLSAAPNVHFQVMNKVSAAAIRKVIVTEDDYGHEMRVGAVLRSLDQTNVQHAGTYTDAISGKSRQFDYRCWKILDKQRLALAIECKNIDPTIPLVLCGAARSDGEAFHDLIESRQGRFEDGAIVQVGLSSITRRARAGNLLYPSEQFVGKSLFRVNLEKGATTRSGESEIYDRWSQALSSARELAVSATRSAKHLHVSSVYSAVLSMIVVTDGALWRAMYDNNGVLVSDPEPVDQSSYYVDQEIEISGPKGKPWFQIFTFSHVHFVTLSGLRQFLLSTVSDRTAWNKIFVSPAETKKVSGADPRDPENR